MKNKGHQSIAVICKTNSDCLKVYKTIRPLLEQYKLNVNLVTKRDTKYKTGIVILPSYLAKGLEFDGVVVYNCNEHNYGREIERKLFYTICTRALHTLRLYYTECLTPLISNVENKLYNHRIIE